MHLFELPPSDCAGRCLDDSIALCFAFLLYLACMLAEKKAWGRLVLTFSLPGLS